MLCFMGSKAACSRLVYLGQYWIVVKLAICPQTQILYTGRVNAWTRTKTRAARTVAQDYNDRSKASFVEHDDRSVKLCSGSGE